MGNGSQREGQVEEQSTGEGSGYLEESPHVKRETKQNLKMIILKKSIVK